MSGSSGPASPLRRWGPWIVVLVVVGGLLAVGTLGQSAPTAQERALALQESIRCPSCASQSVAHSETPAAQAVKVLITERIAAGDTDEEIRDYVASRYGREVLLDPSGKGFGALVWAVPVVFAILAVAALVFRFRDWRPGAGTPTEADRDLVARALAEAEAGPDGVEPAEVDA